jgi:hypothetical protein
MPKIKLHKRRFRGTGCYNHDRQKRKKIDQNKHAGCKDFNMENPSNEKD